MMSSTVSEDKLSKLLHFRELPARSQRALIPLALQILAYADALMIAGPSSLALWESGLQFDSRMENVDCARHSLRFHLEPVRNLVLHALRKSRVPASLDASTSATTAILGQLPPYLREDIDQSLVAPARQRESLFIERVLALPGF